MTTAQKIIKNLAVAFAIFLIITIVSSILSGIYIFGNISEFKINDKKSDFKETIMDFENSDIQALEIDVACVNLTIRNSDTLKVETDKENITCNNDKNKLEIKEENKNLFSKNDSGNLIVYIPTNIELEEINISAGAGKIKIEALTAKEVYLELGAGETTIEQLNVINKCKIDGGAGKVDINSGSINNLDLNMGVGETNITANLIGKNDIDAGIGNLNISLIGNKKAYKIKANKGLGNVKVDGKNISDDQTYGNGDNIIQIDGGIGNITVSFK